jgi:hypothetical protein
MCQICINTSVNNKLILIKSLEKHKYLYCSKCPIITKIPNILGLKDLNCSNCPLLTEIPNIEGLEYLDCSNCPNLTKIPNIETLKMIDCSNCPLLKKLPNFKSLTRFNYIPFNKKLVYRRYILTCFRYKFKIPNKSKQLFKVKLEKYAEHLLDDYVNPNSNYMKYYVSSFGNDFTETQYNKLEIGYLSKDNRKLKLLTFR